MKAIHLEKERDREVNRVLFSPQKKSEIVGE